LLLSGISSQGNIFFSGEHARQITFIVSTRRVRIAAS
jgi:hypothetical protein